MSDTNGFPNKRQRSEETIAMSNSENISSKPVDGNPTESKEDVTSTTIAEAEPLEKNVSPAASNNLPESTTGTNNYNDRGENYDNKANNLGDRAENSGDRGESYDDTTDNYEGSGGNYDNNGEYYDEDEYYSEDFPPMKFEYLDHTADVQIHAWGDNLKEAFEQAGVAMYGYMTEIDRIEVLGEEEISVQADDLLGLLYQYLDELLFLFSAEPFFIARRIEITEFDLENFKITAKCYGEVFDLSKHPQGSEVKAITYSNMQVYNGENGKYELFVIIDI